MAGKTIGVLIGSLRKAAWSRKVAEKLIKLAPSDLNLKIVNINNLPLYNEDDETVNPPAGWVEFRNAIRPLDGILFVTPEYNRSVPAPLKNAIDVGSRPPGNSIWNQKVCAIVSSSPGTIGGFGANNHLRQSLVCLNAPCMPSEVYLSGVNKLFDDKNELNSKTEEFLREFMKAFAVWVKTNSK